MFLVHSLKSIFVEVPGTASTSLSAAMVQKYIKNDMEIFHENRNHPAYDLHPEISMYRHFTIEQAKMCIPEKHWEEYKKIGFVREPYDWAKSIYRKNGTKGSLGVDNDGDFLDFVTKLQKTPYFWLTDRNDKVLVDTIYKTEDIEEIFKKYHLSPKHLAKSPRPNHLAELTSEIKAILKEKFAREYKHYENVDGAT